MASKQSLTVDEYMSHIEPATARATLGRLRKIIREAIPDAEESIKYGIPTYKQNGFVASFAVYKKHCSFFPGHTVRDFADELKGYKMSKGTVQFPHDHELPVELVEAIVKTRVAENAAAVKE